MAACLILDTAKPFDVVCTDLKTALAKHGFGLMAVHDLAVTLLSKGIDQRESCRVFEVCNPQQAAKVLQLDMALSVALPCRISVYTDSGQTRIGMMKPVDMLRDLSALPELNQVAQEVQSAMTALVLEAAAPASLCSIS